MRPPLAVGLRVLRLVDPSRTIRLPDGRRAPRTLLTDIRYPARAAGPFPLVVFGHGYAVTPATYTRLLRAWASAGYVVAAPAFPLENADAPGGPSEADLLNQPADLRFVITRLLAASAAKTGPLHGLIDPARIAVAGHSDGGETALVAAYYPGFRDNRIRAAIVLSGSEIPGRSLAFPRGGPPLLAVQGTADTINPPSLTEQFFAIAPRPKFLLALTGAAHLPPYTSEQPQLGVVERVTIAFLDLELGSGSLRRLVATAAAPGIAKLTADP